MTLPIRPYQPMLEKRLLQAAIMMGCAAPLSAGLLGFWYGAAIFETEGTVTLNSHVRYLSGLLLGMGVGFLSSIPNIERQRCKFSWLTGIVVTGGMARLFGILNDGWPAPSMIFALGMELGVAPALYFWQHRIARQMGNSKPAIMNPVE